MLPPPVSPAPKPAAKPAKPLTIASLTDAALKPSAKPAPKPPTIAPTPPAPIAAAPPAGGWVQIGTYSSSPLAEQGWRDVAKLAPAGMAGKGQRVEPVEKDGKTLYRAYITGFASRDAAEAFCGKLKAAGHACFVK
jgi:cell division protein FtsN